MRSLRLLNLALFSIVLCAGAPTDARAVGSNLAWDDCFQGAPASMKTFTCDADDGAPFTLVGSFVPPEGVDQMNGMQAIVDLCTMPHALPDWWRVGASDCRAGALTASYDFTGGPSSCTDLWQGQAVGAMNVQVAGALGATRLRILLIAAVTTPIALTEGTEYYAFRIHVSRANTSTCAGCLTNGCIVLNEVRLTQAAGAGDVFLTTPEMEYFATWQGMNQSPPCPFVVPTQTSTWGQVKSLYR